MFLKAEIQAAENRSFKTEKMVWRNLLDDQDGEGRKNRKRLESNDGYCELKLQNITVVSNVLEFGCAYFAREPTVSSSSRGQEKRQWSCRGESVFLQVGHSYECCDDLFASKELNCIFRK